MIPIMISFAIAVAILTFYFLLVHAIGWVAKKYLKVTLEPVNIVFTLFLVSIVTLLVYSGLYS